jgi:1-acyl-sn-glycerol-3-phosphate acyltransferase
MSLYFKARELAMRAMDGLVDPEVDARLRRIPNRLNDYGYDAWGFNPEQAKYFYSFAALLYRHYFRVETEGIHHVPPGRVLLIANHGGQLPFDGLMLSTAMLLAAEPPRAVRGMAEKWFPTLPVMSWMMPRLGHVVGTPHNCVQLLEHDEAVMVFPEGVRGSGKLWDERYQLKEFGRGFLRLALRTRTPIVPVGIVGSEEQAPSFANLKPLAKALGFPYFPVGPTLGLPLPSKYHIYFDEPLVFEGHPDEPDAEMERKVEVVKSKIARLLHYGIESREGVFW